MAVRKCFLQSAISKVLIVEFRQLTESTTVAREDQGITSPFAVRMLR